MECFLQRNNRRAKRRHARGQSMDPKITLLIVLIASVIGLSYLTEENLGRLRRQLGQRRWRGFVPLRRRV